VLVVVGCPGGRVLRHPFWLSLERVPQIFGPFARRHGSTRYALVVGQPVGVPKSTCTPRAGQVHVCPIEGRHSRSATNLSMASR
jgi:hypothetical protein